MSPPFIIITQLTYLAKDPLLRSFTLVTLQPSPLHIILIARITKMKWQYYGTDTRLAERILGEFIWSHLVLSGTERSLGLLEP